MMRSVWGWIATDWRLKLAALGIALLVWSAVKTEETATVSVPDVPVRVDVRDAAWALGGSPSPATVTVELTGPIRELLRAAVARPRIVLPVEDVHDSVLVAVIRSNWVHLDGGFARTRVDDVHPGSVRLVFNRIAPPPATSLPGRPPLAPMDTAPDTVRVERDTAHRAPAADSVARPPEKT